MTVVTTATICAIIVVATIVAAAMATVLSYCTCTIRYVYATAPTNMLHVAEWLKLL